MFEDLPRGLDPEKTSHRLAEQAGLYLGILSEYRGTNIPGKNITYTELEYDQTYRLERTPVVVFESENPSIFPSLLRQPHADWQKAKEFNELSHVRHPPIRHFRSPDDLYSETLDVLYSLEAAGKLYPNSDIGMALSAEVPRPPQPFFVQDYSLAVDSELVGRDEELALLDAWIKNPRAPHFSVRVYCIEALGGMGKSALAWTWVNKLVATNQSQFEAIIWYSFYAVETGVHDFAESVLGYLSQLRGIEPILKQDSSPLEKVIQILEQRPVLLVLDGLERRMKLYTDFNARAAEGRELDRIVKVLVERHRMAFFDRPEDTARQMAEDECYSMSVEDAATLQRLARNTKSRTLITSRFFPFDLKRPSHENRPSFHPLAGVDKLPLEPFDIAKAEKLAAALQASWAPEFATLLHKVGGYPLYLALAFAFLTRGRESADEFERRRRMFVNALQRDPEAARIAVITLGIQDLTDRQREPLYEIEMCPIASTFSDLPKALCGESGMFTKPSKLEAELRLLHSRKLIGWDRNTGSCDMHPVVREAVRLQGTPEINSRIMGRHAPEEHHPQLPSSNSALSSYLLSEPLRRLNLLIRSDPKLEKALGYYLGILDPWFRFYSSEIDRRLDWLQRFLEFESQLSVGDRVDILTRLADTLLLKGQPSDARQHATRAYELSRESGDHRLIRMACEVFASIASCQGNLLEADHLLVVAANHGILTEKDDFSRWAFMRQS